MQIKVADKLQNLTNEELIQLSDEMKNTTVPNNALIRQVIKGSEMDTTAPILAFVGVGQLLAHEFADRLRGEMNNRYHG